jgi:lysozyme family protein
MAKFDEADVILSKNEGGYSTDKNDTGNYYQGIFVGTKYGISAPTLAIWLRRPLTTNDVYKMKNLTFDEARIIKKVLFWDRIKGDLFKDQKTANMVFGFYFMKPAHTVTIIKEILGLPTSPASDMLNTKTVNMLNSSETGVFYNQFREKCIDWIKKSKNSKNIKEEWTRRVTAFNDYPQDARRGRILNTLVPPRQDNTGAVVGAFTTATILYIIFS